MYTSFGLFAVFQERQYFRNFYILLPVNTLSVDWHCAYDDQTFRDHALNKRKRVCIPAVKNHVFSFQTLFDATSIGAKEKEIVKSKIVEKNDEF